MKIKRKAVSATPNSSIAYVRIELVSVFALRPQKKAPAAKPRKKANNVADDAYAVLPNSRASCLSHNTS